MLISLKIYSQELGLQEILDRVESSNPEVKIKELDVKIKEKSEKRALKNLILPPINFSTEEEWGVVKSEGVGFKEIEAYIPIFQGGKSVYNYKKSGKDLELTKKDFELAKYRLQESSLSEYFKVLNYRKQVEIINSTINALEKQRVRLNNLYIENRLIAKSEILKIEADLEKNKALNLENLQKERTAKEHLLQFLGYDLNEKIELKEFDSEEYLQRYNRLRTIVEPEETTYAKRQELLIDSAEYDVKIAKADLYPSFYIKPSHKFKEKIGDKLVNKNEGMIEVGFRYVFEWGGTLDNIEQKKYELEKVKIKYKDNIQGLKLDMRNKYSEIKTLIGQSNAQKKRIDLLRENLKIDNLRYDNELISTFDYLNSVNELKVAEEDYYSFQRDLILAIIKYENLYK